ncbi:hypothetical protein [Streptomyces sp. NPDC059909]|uniref:hypothetical protein n=1 Tax=Streptomyces sp. NPDC059909 TaxID=3346998 RepID=UPI0036594521
MNIRMTGLALAVVCAAVLPISASAGPARAPGPEERASERSAPENDKRAVRPGILAEIDAAASPGQERTSERCGPELTSPDGVEAQTCVLTEGRDAWARTYYRNATGERLSSVLSLMAPGGRTVQTRCDVEADDEPGACETPREKAQGEADAYVAVAEFAGSGDLGEGPLLLRSGSNSPSATGG